VGEAYVTGSLPLTILTAAFAFTAFTTALSPALNAMEETKINGAIVAVSVLVGLVAAFFLLPVFGILGASMARASSMVIAAVLIIPVLSRKIALCLDFRWITKTLFAGCTMAAIVFAVQLVHYSKFMLPLYVLIGAIVYLVMLRLLKAVDRNDIELVRGFLGKRLELLSRGLSRILLAPD
jgi:O-antigen/teichoic acid export membrane protein